MTDSEFYTDGASMKTIVEHMKAYHDNNPGGGSSEIPYPVLSIEYGATNDYATITCETDYDLVDGGQVILGYTLDGSTPTNLSWEFHSPQRIEKNATVAVRAFLALSETNLIGSATNSIVVSGLKVQTPVITYDDSTYTITLSCATQGATIHYTIDGTSVSASSPVYNGAIAITESVTIQVLAVKDGIQNSNTVSEQCFVARIFGVEWDYGDSSSALTRLTPSNDPLGVVTETITSEPVIATSSGGGSSPFDAYAPWNGIKRRNFVNNAPGAWEGESGFSTTTNDTMVWIPEFYVKVVDDSSGQKRRYYLSDKPMDGFVLHPGSGQYVGAYVTSNSKESKSGKSFQVNQSIVTMRTNAKSKGTGWGLIDWAERSAIQFLFVIEFANWNSQVLFNQTSGTQNQTGLTDSLSYHTGYNGKVRYRWIEDLWNGVYEWTDGLNVVSGKVYVSTDRENYQSDITEGYTLIDGCAGNNYNIQKLKFDENNPWSIGLPEQTGGSEYTKYIGDDGYILNGTYVLYCGGGWGSSSSHGLFYFYANVTSSGSSSNFGSRLSYKEAS